MRISITIILVNKLMFLKKRIAQTAVILYINAFKYYGYSLFIRIVCLVRKGISEWNGQF